MLKMDLAISGVICVDCGSLATGAVQLYFFTFLFLTFLSYTNEQVQHYPFLKGVEGCKALSCKLFSLSFKVPLC